MTFMKVWRRQISDFENQNLDKLYRQRLAATIEELEIVDHVTTSQFNKLLSRDRHLYDPNMNPSIIVKFLLLNPEQQNDSVSQDAKVRVSIQPIKINLDQDTAVHLYKFFNELSQFALQDEMMLPRDSPLASEDCPELPFEPKPEIFFKEVNFSPDLSIRIDYQVRELVYIQQLQYISGKTSWNKRVWDNSWITDWSWPAQL